MCNMLSAKCNTADCATCCVQRVSAGTVQHVECKVQHYMDYATCCVQSATLRTVQHVECSVCGQGLSANCCWMVVAPNLAPPSDAGLPPSPAPAQLNSDHSIKWVQGTLHWRLGQWSFSNTLRGVIFHNFKKKMKQKRRTAILYRGNEHAQH